MTAPQGPPPGYGPGGYPPAGYGPGAYGAPGYGYGPPALAEHPQGTIVLILGILGLVTCQVMAPFAWVMGNKALAEIDAAPGRYSNRGVVNAGRICGIVGTVLGALSLVLVVLYFASFAVIIAGSATTS